MKAFITVIRNPVNNTISIEKDIFWYHETSSWQGVGKSNCPKKRDKTVLLLSHDAGILNFFNNRSTNASAKSFNAKIKAFRTSARVVRDINFFLFRLAKIYA